ncbi:MAG: hypothetical protein ACX939_11770, partial [Hyphococcus sp.]
MRLWNPLAQSDVLSLVQSLTRPVIISLAALGLGACATLSSGDGGVGGNVAAGSALDYRLSGGARGALAGAFARAMETGAPQTWRGGGAAGV